MSDETFDELPEQMRVRREKLDRLRESGIDPYPVTFPRTATIAEIREKHPDLEAGTETGEKAGVTGRVMLVRNTGKLCFATIRDGSGDLQRNNQVAFRAEVVYGWGVADLDAFAKVIDEV